MPWISHTDTTAFLEKMSKGLEQISSNTSWCTKLHSVLTTRTAEMGSTVERMRKEVQQLCATVRRKTSSELSHTIEESEY